MQRACIPAPAIDYGLCRQRVLLQDELLSKSTVQKLVIINLVTAGIR